MIFRTNYVFNTEMILFCRPDLTIIPNNSNWHIPRYIQGDLQAIKALYFGSKKEFFIIVIIHAYTGSSIQIMIPNYQLLTAKINTDQWYP